jgi:hypothetical protein
VGANRGRRGVEVGVEAGVGTGHVGRVEHGGGGGVRSHVIITDLFNLVTCMNHTSWGKRQLLVHVH